MYAGREGIGGIKAPWKLRKTVSQADLGGGVVLKTNKGGVCRSVDARWKTGMWVRFGLLLNGKLISRGHAAVG